MTVTKGPAKGVATDLKIAQEGAKRFFIGLGWNPYAAVGVKIERAKGPDKSIVSRIASALFAPFELLRVGTLSTANLAVEAAARAKYTKTTDMKGRDVKSSAYDLDLDCFIFGSDMKFKWLISTGENVLSDPGKKVYHSGDNRSGTGGPDDEQVFVETDGLPEDYHHFYFVVKCDSKYSFDQYVNPNVRLADGKDNTSQAECHLGPVKGDKEDKAGVGMFNYIFCHVYRHNDGWKYEIVDKYVPEGVDWKNNLPQLASVV